jgi:hypothetical protein
MSYNGGESGLVTLAGKGRTCTDTNRIPRVVHQGVGGGVKRFNVLKRFTLLKQVGLKTMR